MQTETLAPSYGIEEKRKKQRELSRRYYHENKEAVKARTKMASPEVKARKRERTKKWKEDNRARLTVYNRKWLAEHPQNKIQYRKAQKRTPLSPSRRLAHNLRHRLREFLKLSGKRSSAFFGCTGEQLKKHIEAQFTKGMSWENYGQWHVDHIVPCAAFDLSDEAQAHICFNWQNLRPLCAKENIAKSHSNTHPQVHLPLVMGA